MADEKLIQLTLQLPVSELASVTALLEQLRQLLTEERPRASTAEVSAQSDSFDEARFQAMLLTSPASAPALSEQPESAVDRGPDESSAAASELPVSRADGADVAVEATEAAFGELPLAVSGSPTADSPLSEEPAPVIDSVLSPAAALGGGAGSPQRESPDLQVEPLTAGVPDFSALASPGASGAAAPSPAPQYPESQPVVTAEALSLAFRRDDRRYDSGFPLY